jgi:transketolase N-terminal domain/subunit
VRSLFDTADLGSLRALLTDAGAPELGVLRVLLACGAVAHDPADPGWADRDHVVLGGEAVCAAAEDAFPGAGYPPSRPGSPPAGRVEDGGRALGVALGMAAASSMDGGVARVWCVLDATVADDGAVWEAAASAAQTATGTLVAVVVGGPGAQRWASCGWDVHEAAARDLPGVLGALDQALAASGPSTVGGGVPCVVRVDP